MSLGDFELVAFEVLYKRMRCFDVSRIVPIETDLEGSAINRPSSTLQNDVI